MDSWDDLNDSLQEEEYSDDCNSTNTYDDEYDSTDLDQDDDDVDDDNDDNEFLDKDNEETSPSPSPSSCHYRVLKEQDIKQRQHKHITQVCNVLHLSKDSASLLLRCFNWNVDKLHEEWFADEAKVRTSVGLLDSSIDDKPILNSTSTIQEVANCGICFEDYSFPSLRSAGCGHLFCEECWGCYVTTAINDGPGCLMLRCPDPSCTAFVGQDLMDKLKLADKEKEKYCSYVVRSYVEKRGNVKWCPAPGCDSAVELGGRDNSYYDVSCSCSHAFCWNCTEEAHRPVDCGTVAKWILKNGAEAENTKWILANSKHCPKCSRPIQKNQGCMHMTCPAPCRFQFCWLCLEAWSSHSLNGLNYYSCNRYEAARRDGLHNESEKQRNEAKKSIDRYAHYYERWASNEVALKQALAGLAAVQNMHLAKLSQVHALPETELEFIVQAWQQIVECRRVLKWTYAYGYYLPENKSARKQLFEYLQGEAESGLERLHQCAENEAMEHLKADLSSENFICFRTKVVTLTNVTRNYFENLVRALENGLSDISSQEMQEMQEEEPTSKENQGGIWGFLRAMVPL